MLLRTCLAGILWKVCSDLTDSLLNWTVNEIYFHRFANHLNYFCVFALKLFKVVVEYYNENSLKR